MNIPWIEIIERDGDDERVIQEYPFPDIKDILISNIDELKKALSDIPCEHTRLASETRLHFILERWHRKNFYHVTMKRWKYAN